MVIYGAYTDFFSSGDRLTLTIQRKKISTCSYEEVVKVMIRTENSERLMCKL